MGEEREGVFWGGGLHRRGDLPSEVGGVGDEHVVRLFWNPVSEVVKLR